MRSNIFRGYYLVILTSFSLVILIAFLLAFWQLKGRLQYEENQIHSQFQQNIASLNQITSVLQTRLDALAAESGFILENDKFRFNSPLQSYLQDNKKENYFHLDSLPTYVNANDIGNLTGLGSLQQLSQKKNLQISVALQLNQAIKNTVNQTPNVVLGYFIGDSLGIIYPRIASKDFHIAPITIENFGKTYTDKEKSKKTLRWTPIYLDETGKGLMVSAYLPVHKGSENYGIIGLDVTLDSLNYIIRKAQRDLGDIFIINETKQLVAHPRLVSSKSKDIKLFDTALPADLKKNLDLSTLKEKYLNLVANHFVYFEQIPNTQWHLVYVVNSWATYNKIFADIGLSLGFTLLSITVVLFISTFYTRKRFILPAGKLVQHIQNENQNLTNQSFNVPKVWQEWFEIISKIFENNRVMLQELTDYSEQLEDKVKQRTFELQVKQEEIMAQNEELHQNQEEIMAQRDFIAQNNKELMQRERLINSSMKVAQTIQHAILPYPQKLNDLLKEYFVINRPKDVVSGDFFWLNKIDNYTFLIVADCTGHGVPGAFMTLIGDILLDKIVRIWKIYEPTQILERLHEEIRRVLRQDETESNYGMDIAVLRIQPEMENNFIIDFAGAKRNLYFIKPQTNEIQELKGSRKSVGGWTNKNINFENHTLLLPKESLIYLQSDGFADQNNMQRKRFGEEKLKQLLAEIHQEDLQTQKDILTDTLQKYMQDTSQRDDILLIGFKLTGDI